MARQEFPRAIKVSCIKDATRNGVIYCELCGLPAKKFQIDHRIADAHGGKPVRENAQLICEPCFQVKNPIDTTIAAKLKRIEARHVGAKHPAGTIKSPGFARKERREKLPLPPARSMYEEIER